MIRIAVVGGGPKCLFALLALNDHFAAGPQPQLAVDVYDPLPPGAGSVWRVDQPRVLRLNVQAGIVDASSSLSTESFTAWAARAAPEMSGEDYPPRALVGSYLSEQFRLLCRHGRIGLTHAPFAVTNVERANGRWLVSGHFGARHYDEVLLATGHGLADAPTPQPPAGALNTRPLIGDYTAVGLSTVPAGSEVWIRGAALTAYDVALLLSEGRGGGWLSLEDDGDAGTRLRYRASGQEPRRITLSSRSGALMDPKCASVPPAVANVVADHRERLRHWGARTRVNTPSDAATLNGMWTVLLHCAQDCARAMGLTVSELALWRTALTGRSAAAGNPRAQPSQAAGPAAQLRDSLDVNRLAAPMTTGWLLARAWSGLYAELVRAMDRLPRDTREFSRFRRVARHLEKFAFGPPEATAQKLLALFDTGLLQLAAAEEKPPPGSVIIDAVTPGPGALRSAAPEGGANSGLFARLLESGAISVRPGDRGLLTATDGTCVAEDGSRTESLAALGRPTEDPTLGHDTLNRSLHGEHRLWARRIAGIVTGQTDPLGHHDDG